MLNLVLLSRIEQQIISSVNGGRIDYDSPTTIKWHPYHHGSIGIYNGESWSLVVPSSTTSGCVYFDLESDTDLNNNAILEEKQYDVYASYVDAESFKLDLIPWSSDNSRGYSIGNFDGIVVSRNDSDGRKRRYLGVIRTLSSSGPKFVDSETQRFICNWVNRVPKIVKTYNSYSGNWTSWTDGAWKELRSGSFQIRGEFLYLNSGELLIGANQGPSATNASAATDSYHLLALNSTDPNGGIWSRVTENDRQHQLYPSLYKGTPRLGYNYITQMMRSYRADPYDTYGGQISGAYLMLYV